MLRFGLPGIFGILMLLFWVWCIFDVVATDEALCRNLPKFGWLVLVIILPDVGGIAWVLLGRPERAGFRPGDTTVRRSAVRGPDDDPGFVRSMYSPAPPTPRSGPSGAEVDERRAHLEAWEDDLARREAELKAAELQRREDELRRRSEGGDG